MKKLFFFFAALFISAAVHAQNAADIPQHSLFLTDQETRRAEALAANTLQAGDGDITLGAIMFYAPGDWSVWIQGEKWTPATTHENIHIIKVTRDTVDLQWHDDDMNRDQEISLHPNESYQISTGKIVKTPAP